MRSKLVKRKSIKRNEKHEDFAERNKFSIGISVLTLTLLFLASLNKFMSVNPLDRSFGDINSSLTNILISGSLSLLFLLSCVYVIIILLFLLLELYFMDEENPPKNIIALKKNIFYMVCKFPIDLLFKYTILFALGILFFVMAIATSGFLQAILMVIFVGYIILLFIMRYIRKKKTSEVSLRQLYIGLILIVICLSFLFIDSYSFVTSSVDMTTDKLVYNYNNSIFAIFNPVGFTNEGINKITLNKNISLFDAGEGIRSGSQYIFIESNLLDKNKTTQTIKVDYLYKRALFFSSSKSEIFNIPYKTN